MPQVPYNPVPSVSPENIATPGPRLDTPIGAFGGDVAAATSRLGNVMERAGDELFGRAIALQQLNNEAEAREADTNYMIEAGNLHANYNALEGKARVDAFPKYAQDLKEARERIKAGLKNPASQRLFDQQSMGTMGRSIFNGAGAAASANRQYQHATIDGQISLDAQTVEDNPNDIGLRNDKLSRVEAATRTKAAMMGLDGAAEENMVMLAKSKVMASYYLGLAKKEPFRALAEFEKDKTLTEGDRLRVDSVIRTQGRGVGAVNIANDVWDPTKSLEQMQQEARDKAKKLNPEDPLLEKDAVINVNSRYNQDKAGKRQQELEDGQSVYDLVVKNRPRNEQEFMQLPGADALIERMKPSERAKLPSRIYNYNKNADSFDNDKRYLEIRGMLQSDDPAAVEEGLNLNAMDQKLSQRQMISVMDMQRRLKDKGNDPRVKNAAQIMRAEFGSQLQALGVYNRSAKDPTDYDHYMGTLSAALDVWNENHPGKPATAKDIKETIGPLIIRQSSEPWFRIPFLGTPVGTSTTDPFFKQTVPEDAAARIRQQAGNAGMTEQAIYREYLRNQLKDLFGTKKGDKAETP